MNAERLLQSARGTHVAAARDRGQATLAVVEGPRARKSREITLSLFCCHAVHPNIAHPVHYLTHFPKLVAAAICVPYAAFLSRDASRLQRLASQKRSRREPPLRVMQNNSGHGCIENQDERRRTKPSMLAHRKRPARSRRTKQWVPV